MMNDAVFISDLHLHPQNNTLHQRFEEFVRWAQTHTKRIYILGDFIHVWAGDDLIDDYGLKIINLLQQLHFAGVKVYFMPGNRDFLIGKTFLAQAKVTLIEDASVITIGSSRFYLSHGDRYCTNDKAHQFLRFLTRNHLFKTLFLALPPKIRHFFVNRLRYHSQHKKRPNQAVFQINPKKLFQDMRKYQVFDSIYGHVHHQAHYQDEYQHFIYQRYVLGDWDHHRSILCYNNLIGLYFYQRED